VLMVLFGFIPASHLKNRNQSGLEKEIWNSQ